MTDKKPDMRKIEATAFLREIEKRDPCCMALFIAAMERYQRVSPGISLKDFYAMAILGIRDDILKMKEKEFLCPYSSAGRTADEEQSPSGAKTTIAA